MASPSPVLLKACGKGNNAACEIAKKINAIYAGTVVSFSKASIDNKHPNKLPFTGTLLLVNQPSNKPPHGSQGHRIFVSKKVALAKLDTLPGMAVNYNTGDLAEHSTRHKVGVITKAWVEGENVKVSGFVWKKDFPESVDDLSHRKDLGMSMELADVYVRDENESVWHLEDFSFTGATILKKDAAAYTNTSLAAKAAAIGEKGATMAKPVVQDKPKKKAAATRDTGQTHSSGNLALLAQAIGGQISTALSPIVSEMKASNDRLQESFEELSGRLRLMEVNASAATADADDDDEIVLSAAREDDDDMAAARQAADDDADDSDDSSDDDSSDEDELEAMEDLVKKPAAWEPGEVNKSAKNQGSKTSVTKPPRQGEDFPGNVAKGRISSAAGRGKAKMKVGKPFPGLKSGASIEAAAVQITTLHAQNRKLVKTLKAMQQQSKKVVGRLNTKIATMAASLERFADMEARRSQMPVELTNLAAKAGVNLQEIKAAGQTLSVQAVDEIFAHARNIGINIEPKQRIAMKMLLEEQGLMDAGVIDRGYGRAN